jgi:ribosome-binding factor A
MSKRTLRVNQLLQKELSQILLREIDFFPDALVTITRVEVNPDLGAAKVYISCFPEDKSKEIFQILKREVYSIQKELDKRLKMKTVPKIKFLEEEKTKEAGEVEELLEKINRLKKEEE